MKQLLIFMTTLLFIGCGSESNTTATSDTQVVTAAVLPASLSSESSTTVTLDTQGTDQRVQGTISMDTSQVYQVYKGDAIKKLSEDAQIIIIHNDGENESSVELIQGKAELIRNL